MKYWVYSSFPQRQTGPNTGHPSTPGPHGSGSRVRNRLGKLKKTTTPNTEAIGGDRGALAEAQSADWM